MVEASLEGWNRRGRGLAAARRLKRLGVTAGVGLCGLALAGCNVVPSTRLEDCRRLSQTLQTENARLKDSTVSLRTQNQDLNQRALDEARRLRLQEEEIERLSQSVTAYQAERDQFAAAYERLKGEVRASTTATATASTGRVGRSDP